MGNQVEEKQILRKKSLFERFLDGVEKAGNKLPDPVIIFAVLTAAVTVFSLIGSLLGWSVKNPTSGDMVKVFNLLSPSGIQYMISNTYQNYSKFAPFAIAMPLFLAVGIMDQSGLLETVFIRLGSKVRGRWLTMMVVFIGVMSNFMSDIGFVMLPPLAAMLFAAVKRNPIVGMCCAYASVGCGLAANLLIGISDARMAATSQAAAQIIDPNAVVLPTANWYFIIAACVVLTLVATFVTDKILEPHMGAWDASRGAADIKSADLSAYQATPAQKKGMQAASLTVLIMIAIFLIGCLPSWGFLRNADGLNVFVASGTQLGAIVTAMLLFIAIPAAVYGRVVGTIPDGKAFGAAMSKGLRDVAPFAVLCFFAGQFTDWFTKSNLGIIAAISGANVIKESGFGGLPLMLVLILVCALLNLLIPSANAKYSLLAPIIVPMFMMLGYSPALTQMVYRIGDSTTNAITPLMAYFALMLGLVKNYDKDAGMGTLMSLLMPYTLFYGLAWTILFSIWFLLGLPLGPGGALYL